MAGALVLAGAACVVGALRVLAGVLVVVAGRIAVAAAGVGALLVATDADEAGALVVEAAEVGALVETFGVIGWALVAEATEVADEAGTLETVAGGAISTVTLGALVPAPVPALLAGVSP
jgi:hypothetical protein